MHELDGVLAGRLLGRALREVVAKPPEQLPVGGIEDGARVGCGVHGVVEHNRQPSARPDHPGCLDEEGSGLTDVLHRQDDIGGVGRPVHEEAQRRQTTEHDRPVAPRPAGQRPVDVHPDDRCTALGHQTQHPAFPAAEVQHPTAIQVPGDVEEQRDHFLQVGGLIDLFEPPVGQLGPLVHRLDHSLNRRRARDDTIG